MKSETNKQFTIDKKPFKFNCKEMFKGNYSVKHEWGDECEIINYPFTVTSTDKHNEETKESLLTVEVTWDEKAPVLSRSIENQIRMDFLNSLNKEN